MQEWREQLCKSGLLPSGVGLLRSSTVKRALWYSACHLAALKDVIRLSELGVTPPLLHLTPDLRAPPSSSFCSCPTPVSVRHTCGPPGGTFKLARGPWLGFTTSLLIPGPSRWAGTHRAELEGTQRPRRVAAPGWTLGGQGILKS